jgi:benzoyl-CoA reductase subunit C
MDKAEHNQWLQELLASKPQASAGGVRLLALGSENDDTGIIELLESLGASVVIEDNCLGNRYFWDEVSPDGDGLKMVATRYLQKPPCPQRDIGPRVRANYLTALAKEYDVQGIVFLRQKFCDPHAYEVPILQQVFKDQGLPALILELDVTTPHGQYRTRIEAFMEMFL